MSFEVIPALDLWGGRLARMPGGDPSAVERLPGDPIDVARRLIDQGARWLHVVDLNAAVTGSPANFDVLERIAALGASVQAGGSLSPEVADEALARGASRAVLGAAVLSNPPGLASAVARHGERVGVALDVREGAVVPRGSAGPGPALPEALTIISLARPGFVTFTATASDGTGTGPDVDALGSVIRSLRIPVIASGGVGSLADLQRLAGMERPPVGVIIGRALHEGAFTLQEALRAVGQPAEPSPVADLPARAPSPRPRDAAAITRFVILGAGVVAAVGALIPWARVATDRSSAEVAGISTAPGLLALVSALALGAVAAMGIHRAQRPSARRLGVMAVLAVLIVAAAVSVLATREQQIERGVRNRLRAEGRPASAANVRREFSELVRRGLETSFGPGVYLEIVAGAAALAAIGFGAAVA
ncbi:MAG: HisA/HisF-related TIM barrel protein, partial [Actinomycetota bacterium]